MSKPLPPHDYQAKPQVPGEMSSKATLALVLGFLSFCFSLFTAIPAFILGIMALSEINASNGKLKGKGLAAFALVLAGIGMLGSCIMPALLLPAVQMAREAARRQASSNNLKMIGFAMQNYHNTYVRLPLAGSEDPQHGIGLSWHVRILPFMEHDPLYQEFHHDEPWNSPHNLAVAERMPDIYRSPNHNGPANTTVYLGVVTPRNATDQRGRRLATAFSTDPPFSSSLREFTDGTAATIVFVEADSSEAVIWTKPDDWELDASNPRRGLGTMRPGGFLACMGDGSVQFIPNTIDDQSLVYLFSRNDGVPVAVPQGP